MAIACISFSCFLVLYSVLAWLQRPSDSSFAREFFTLRRPPLQITGVHPDILLWHSYSWLRWGLAAAMPFTVLDYLKRTNPLSSQNPVLLTVQFVLFWIVVSGILIGLYRIYCLLCWHFQGGIRQGLQQLWRAKWMQKLFGSPRQGEDVRLDLIISSQEAALGCEKTLTLNHLILCEVCWGKGVLRTRRPHACPSCLGVGVRSSDRYTPCSTCKGLGLTFSQLCAACKGSGQSPDSKIITVQVPAGVKPQTRLRIAQKGQPAISNFMLPGDLYIYLSIQEKTK